MKKNSNKIISIFLSVIMLMAYLPTMTFAENSGDYTYLLDADDSAIITTVNTGVSGDVIIPGELDGHTVTAIYDFAFKDCTLITSITIPDSVKQIGNETTSSGIFSGCTLLKSINVGENNEYYSSQDGVLFNKTKTEILSYPVGKAGTSYVIPSSVASIKDHAFEFCSSLSSITIPDSVTSIKYNAFKYCTSLTSIIIPDSVTSIESDAFSDCKSLANIKIPNNLKAINGSLFCNCKALTNITIPDSVTSIGALSFYGCNLLTSITIPDNVTVIESDAFSECTSLANIIIPDNITEIGDNAFDNTAYYKNDGNWTNGVLYLKNYLLDSKKDLSGTYEIKPDTKCVAGGAFSGCTLLTNVTIPNSIATIDYHAFSGCSSLKSVTIPDSVTSINLCAFANCTSLENVTIPNSVTSIDQSAFMNCEALKSVTIPDSVTSIGWFAFQNCKSLTSITIPNTFKSIAVSAFRGCSSLTTVTIPNTVKTIDTSAFLDCNNISDVYYSGTEEQWKNINIKAENESLTSATIHFTDSQLEHTWSEWTVTTPATCTVKGVETRTCSDCGATETRDIAALGHDYSPDWTIDKAPSCIASGHKSRHCTRCTAITESTEIPPTEHPFSDWITLTYATYSSKGVETRICPICGTTEKRDIPKIEMTNEVKDENSGISVLYKDDSFANEIELNVVQKFDGESYQLFKKNFKNAKFALYDIFVTSNGEKVQPVGGVLVKLPVPEGYDIDKLAVYYATENGTFSKINSYYENGYVYFEASHFSDYALVDTTTISGTEPTTENTTAPSTNPTETTKPIQETTTASNTKPSTNPTETTKPPQETTTDLNTKPSDETTVTTTRLTSDSTTRPTSDSTTKPSTDFTEIDGPIQEITSEDTSFTQTPMLGDVNDDGKIDASDARLALRISASLEIATDIQLLAADVDKNNIITAADARKILRVSAQLENF